jgi:hypothetical protein
MRRQKTKEERLFYLSTKCFARATAGRYSLVGTSEFVTFIEQPSGSICYLTPNAPAASNAGFCGVSVDEMATLNESTGRQ